MSVLGLGQAFGRVPRRWTADSLALSPVIHDHARTNAAHVHEAAFISVMLDGEYAETAARRSYRFDRLTTIYHPPGVEHQDFIGRPGVRLLMFEFDPRILEGGEKNRHAEDLRDLSGSRLSFDLLSLYREVNGDSSDFESRALELLAQLLPALRTIPRDRPALDRARDYLREHFREPVRMQEVARAAGRHPVYVGQSFRREFGETVSDFVMRLRIRAAAEQLISTQATVAAIAFENGFCDQSHFHRVFRKWSGLTPAKFRSESQGLSGRG